MSKAAMTVIAVPVMYSALNDRAHATMPVRSSHWPNARKFARSRVKATGTMMTSLRVLMVMIRSTFPCVFAPNSS